MNGNAHVQFPRLRVLRSHLWLEFWKRLPHRVRLPHRTPVRRNVKYLHADCSSSSHPTGASIRLHIRNLDAGFHPMVIRPSLGWIHAVGELWARHEARSEDNLA